MVDLLVGGSVFLKFLSAHAFIGMLLSFRVNGLAGIEEVGIVDASRYFSR